jgi:hypothetical protein
MSKLREGTIGFYIYLVGNQPKKVTAPHSVGSTGL